MPITQLWVLASVPNHLEEEVSSAYTTALMTAKTYLGNHIRAFDDWCRDPSTFLCSQEVYDIQRRFKCRSPLNPWSWQTYLSFFSRPEFETLYYEYGGRYTFSLFNEETIIKNVVTYGNTPVDILYQALGPERAKQLPGFFGNFLILYQNVRSECRRLSDLLYTSDWAAMIDRAEKWTRGYNDYDRVKEVIHALPQALDEAASRSCGLLGLQITVG